MEAKPCPFCGNYRIRIIEGIISIDTKRFDKATKICCGNCGAQIIKQTTNEAVEAWNKRQQSAEPGLITELLVSALTVAASEWESSHPDDAKMANTLKRHIKKQRRILCRKEGGNR